MVESITSFALTKSESGAFVLADALRRVWPRSVRTAYMMLGCMQTAQDVVQDACLTAFRKSGGLRDFGSFEAWFLTIVVRRAYAASKRRRTLDTVANVAPDTDVAALLDVRRALAALSPKTRAAVVLCDVMEFTSEEAGTYLGCAASTIRNRVFRGRRALAVALADYAPKA